MGLETIQDLITFKNVEGGRDATETSDSSGPLFHVKLRKHKIQKKKNAKKLARAVKERMTPTEEKRADYEKKKVNQLKEAKGLVGNFTINLKSQC